MDIKSNLLTCFRRIIKSILTGKQKLRDRPYEFIPKDELQKTNYEVLKESVELGKRYFRDFIKQTKKSATNEDKIDSYFQNRFIIRAFCLYVDYLLTGATIENLYKRVGFEQISKDKDSPSIEDLNDLLKFTVIENYAELLNRMPEIEMCEIMSSDENESDQNMNTISEFQKNQSDCDSYDSLNDHMIEIDYHTMVDESQRREELKSPAIDSKASVSKSYRL